MSVDTPSMTPPPQSPPSGASSGNDFVGYNEWAADTLGVTIATDFVYEVADDGDRGVFIAEDIAPHTEVFAIPRDAMLTVRSVHETPSLAPLAKLPFFQQCDSECEDDQLALALLFEKHVTGAASKWSEHIALLPATYHNVLYFGADALKCLRGSNLFLIAQQMEQKVADDYAVLHEAVLAPLFDALLTTGATSLTRAELEQSFSLASYKWALSTIWSRFVSLRVGKWDASESSATTAATAETPTLASSELATSPADFFGMARVKAMVPVFDMLNHDPEAEMAHFYDVETQHFRLVSHQHWSAGAQMFINYGALSNHKLLALYGFVVDPNAYDALDLWVPMDETTSSRFEAKAAVLAANGLDHASTPFELTQDELNELLLITVRIQEIECDSDDELEALAAKALDGEVLSVENEHATLTRLIYTLQKMLDEFSDDSVGDASERPDDGGTPSLHERMAVVVRRSDETILTETIEMLKWKLLEILPTP